MEPDFANEISGRTDEPLPLGRLERVVLIVAASIIGAAFAGLLLIGATALWRAAGMG